MGQEIFKGLKFAGDILSFRVSLRGLGGISLRANEVEYSPTGVGIGRQLAEWKQLRLQSGTSWLWIPAGTTSEPVSHWSRGFVRPREMSVSSGCEDSWSMLKMSHPVPGLRRNVVLALPGGHQGSDGTQHPGLWLQRPEGSKPGGKFGHSICPAAIPAPIPALWRLTHQRSPQCLCSALSP